MEFIKHIFSHLGLWHQPRPNALETSPIGKLPPEITLCVTDFLPRASAAAFSLCCRPICTMLGAYAFAALKDGDELKTMREYLALLERDLPDHLACFYCGKLHSIKKSRRYTRSYDYRGRWDGSELPQCRKPRVLSWITRILIGTSVISFFRWR